LHSVIFSRAIAPHAAALRGILVVFAAATILLGGLMCYAEHHLKRLLAFSTICHAGLMLLAFGIGGPLAIAAMLTYLLAHALIKSELFFTAGILLHRMRTISERQLFGRGRELHWPAALWFLGGAGLAAAPGFATMLAEGGVSRAADESGLRGISLLFLFGGTFTAAAVFRVGMHTFFGLGDEPLTDEAAEVGEMPETANKDQRIFWYHLFPPALCISMAIAIPFVPGWLPILRDAAATLTSQAAYLHTVYTGAALRGTINTLLAIGLAGTSVFRGKIKRLFAVGNWLEGDLSALRAMQSGHPGDYVLWITIGLAVFGSAAICLLRS
jgi:multicomponent Na+:H+ antiporter subunit D